MSHLKCQMSFVNSVKSFVGAYLQSFPSHFSQFDLIWEIFVYLTCVLVWHKEEVQESQEEAWQTAVAVPLLQADVFKAWNSLLLA